MLHISISPEILFYLSGFPISNTLLASFCVVFFLAIIAILFHIKRNDTNSSFVFFIRFCLTKLHDMFSPVLQDKTTTFFPYVASLFIFILISNWFGLIPGVGSVTTLLHDKQVPLLKAGTADLNTTLGLAITTVLLIQVVGIKYLGFLGYLSKFISLKSPIAFFSGILEIISEFSKIISFAFRLFGNIFAGEVLLVVIAFLIPVLASFPFLLLEIFVGFIQALVFAMLTAVFINLATAKHV